MLNNIQALRGIAALMVLCHHALPHFYAMGLSNAVFEFIAKFSYIGVDVFFVISGFVMAKTTEGQESNVTNGTMFLGKRFSRIYLGYWPVFAMAIVLFLIYEPKALENKELIQSFFLVNANMFDLVIAPSWSLTYELYFYCLIALPFFFSFIQVKRLLLFMLVLILIKQATTDLGTNPFLDFFFSTLLFEFCAGYFLCVYLKHMATKRLLIPALILGVGSLLCGVYINIGYGYLRVLTFGFFAFSLVWLSLILEKNGVWRAKGLIKKTGDFSYTLYLTHTVFLAWFFWSGLRELFVRHAMPAVGFCLMLLSIILVSWLIYSVLERPLYKISKKKITEFSDDIH